MSARRSGPSRTIRTAIALALGALVAVLLPMASATAAKPDPAPVLGIATHIRFDEISTPTITLPDAPGTVGLWYVVRGVAFQADLRFLDDAAAPAPLSDNKTVTVTVSYGRTVLGSVDVAAGDKTAVVPLQAIPDAASGVTLTASAAIKPKPVTGTSAAFDVLLESKFLASTGRSTIGGAGGTAMECNATPEFPVCADLSPPGERFIR